jgi:AhpD family alkylhydroperoxidase
MTSSTDSGTDATAGFPKKSFTPRTFLSGVRRAVWNVPALVRARRAGRVSEQFAEKIMLATTAVNECQYCTRFHRGIAREAGVDSDVIDAILEEDIDSAVDEDERVALLFAQRYAETDEDPGEEAIAEIEAEYGPEMAADVRAYVRAIYFGNLLGNSYDALKYRLSNRFDDCTEGLRHVVTGTARLFDR